MEEASAIGNDTLRCAKLDADRYVAYRSLDGTRLELIPDERGDIERSGDSVTIPGIDRFMTHCLPCNLRTAQSRNGLIVEIGQ